MDIDRGRGGVAKSAPTGRRKSDAIACSRNVSFSTLAPQHLINQLQPGRVFPQLLHSPLSSGL
jgi:hypothetical protein